MKLNLLLVFDKSRFDSVVQSNLTRSEVGESYCDHDLSGNEKLKQTVPPLIQEPFIAIQNC